MNYDYILKHLCLDEVDPQTKLPLVDISFYPLIVKSLCLMIERGVCINKINFVFKSPSNKVFEDDIKKYQAFCKYDLNDDYTTILENSDFTKDHKKKPVKVPEFEEDLKTSKYFQKTVDHNILIYDKVAEFIIRNKILESAIRTIHNDIDTKPIFKTFNEAYEQVVSTSLIESTIQSYSIKPSEIQT